MSTILLPTVALSPGRTTVTATYAGSAPVVGLFLRLPEYGPASLAVRSVMGAPLPASLPADGESYVARRLDPLPLPFGTIAPGETISVELENLTGQDVLLQGATVEAEDA